MSYGSRGFASDGETEDGALSRGVISDPTIVDRDEHGGKYSVPEQTSTNQNIIHTYRCLFIKVHTTFPRHLLESPH